MTKFDDDLVCTIWDMLSETCMSNHLMEKSDPKNSKEGSELGV